MAKVLLANNAKSTLASGIDEDDTSISLAPGEGARFPSPGVGEYFYATIVDASGNREIIKCTSRTDDTLTVVRGQDGTSARSFGSGDVIELRLVAAAFENFLQEVVQDTSPQLGGDLDLNGNDITGDDLWKKAFIPAGAFLPSASHPCASLAIYDAGAPEFGYLAFDDTINERAVAVVTAPDEWDGTNIKAIVHWGAPEETTSGDVMWRVDIKSVGDGDDMSTGQDVHNTVTDSHNGAKKLNTTSAIEYSTLAGAGTDILGVSVARIANDESDTLVGDAWLWGVTLIFKVSKLN